MTRSVPAQTDVDNALRQAAGALALAGHEITDETVNDLVRRTAEGEFSVEEMIAQLRLHLDTR